MRGKEVSAKPHNTIVSFSGPGFRLVVGENKRPASGDKDTSPLVDRYFAQLMAEALAVSQANLKRTKRSNQEPPPVSASGARSSSSAHVPILPQIFCLLVVGTNFQFYRTDMNEQFLEEIEGKNIM